MQDATHWAQDDKKGVEKDRRKHEVLDLEGLLFLHGPNDTYMLCFVCKVKRKKKGYNTHRGKG